MGKGYPETYAPEQHGYPPHQGGYPPQQQYAMQPAPVIQQPLQQSSTQVNVNTGKRVVNLKRPWSSSYFACMEDVSGCICGMFCFPCLLINLTTRMDECCLLPFCVPGALTAMRVKLRAQHGIQGSICRDYCLASCCPVLTACQMKRELDNIDARKPKTEL